MLPSSTFESQEKGDASRRGSETGRVSDDLEHGKLEHEDDETLTEASSAVPPPPQQDKTKESAPAREIEIIIIASSASEEDSDEVETPAAAETTTPDKKAAKNPPSEISNIDAQSKSSLSPLLPSDPSAVPSVLDRLVALHQQDANNVQDHNDEKKELSVLESLADSRRKAMASKKSTASTQNAFARSYRVEQPIEPTLATPTPFSQKSPARTFGAQSVKRAATATAGSLAGKRTPIQIGQQRPSDAAVKSSRKRQRSRSPRFNNPQHQRDSFSAVMDLEYHDGVYVYDRSNLQLKQRAKTDPTFNPHYSPDKFQRVVTQHESSSNGRRLYTRGQHEAQQRENESNSNGRIDKTIMIGPQYQCHVPSRVFLDYNMTKTSTNSDMIWDSAKAEQAKSRGEPIYNFLSSGDTTLELQALKMEALHLADYCVVDAQEHLTGLIATSLGYSNIRLTAEEQALFAQLIRQGQDAASTKRFHDIAETMGRSVKAILVHYYRWKTQYPTAYMALKAKRNEEPDECEVCQDGGNLILCDNCNKAYHWKTCLPKPLDKPPAKDEDWYCPKCVSGTPAKLRRLCNNGSRRLDTGPPSPSARLAPSSLLADQHLRSLRKVHLELCKSPAIQISLPSNDASAWARTAPDTNTMVWDSRLRIFRDVETDQLGDAGLRQQLFGPPNADGERGGDALPRDETGVTAHDDECCDDDDETDAASVESLGLQSSSSGLSSSDNESRIRRARPSRKEVLSSPENSDSSFHDSDISVDDDSDDENVTNGKSVKTTPHASTHNPRIYTTIIPIGATGLNVVFGETADNRTIFKSYDRPNGLIGLAEKANVFKSLDDEVVEIEGMSCLGKTFDETLNLIKSLILKSKGKPNPTIRFKMCSMAAASPLKTTQHRPVTSTTPNATLQTISHRKTPFEFSKNKSLKTVEHQQAVHCGQKLQGQDGLRGESIALTGGESPCRSVRVVESTPPQASQQASNSSIKRHSVPRNAQVAVAPLPMDSLSVQALQTAQPHQPERKVCVSDKLGRNAMSQSQCSGAASDCTVGPIQHRDQAKTESSVASNELFNQQSTSSSSATSLQKHSLGYNRPVHASGKPLPRLSGDFEAKRSKIYGDNRHDNKQMPTKNPSQPAASSNPRFSQHLVAERAGTAVRPMPMLASVSADEDIGPQAHMEAQIATSARAHAPFALANQPLGGTLPLFQDNLVETSMLTAFHDKRHFLDFLIANNITTSHQVFTFSSDVLARMWCIHLGLHPNDHTSRDFVGAMKFRLMEVQKLG